MQYLSQISVSYTHLDVYKRQHKSFPGVRALQAVDFTLCEGEIHALMGENGAGKSTLIKAVSYTHLDVYKRQVLLCEVPFLYQEQKFYFQKKKYVTIKKMCIRDRPLPAKVEDVG